MEIYKHARSKLFRIIFSITLSFSLLICTVLISTYTTVTTNASIRRLTPIYSVDRDDKKIAISFDAAWGADKTQSIIDTLLKYDITATFFLVSFWAEKYPEQVLAIEKAGFEIGTHSSTHPHFNNLSKEQMQNELQNSIDVIHNIVDCEINVFRPPFGEYNNTMIELCKEMDIKPIQWDVDSLDWKGIPASEIATRITSKCKSGSIILCHNNSDHILESLDIVIPKLQEQGYEFVTMSELIYHENYTIDSNGVQHIANNN